MDASYYRMIAIAYWDSAKILEQHLSDKDMRRVPHVYLVSHAIELFLKCALLKRGVSINELKDVKLRHDLENLLNALLKKSIPVSKCTCEIVIKLAKQHKEHKLRYDVYTDDNEATYAPPPKVINSAIEELMMLGRVSTHNI